MRGAPQIGFSATMFVETLEANAVVYCAAGAAEIGQCEQFYTDSVSRSAHASRPQLTTRNGMLVTIGVLLFAEGIGTPINKGYIYASMVFALAVELLNMRARRSKDAKKKAALKTEHDEAADLDPFELTVRIGVHTGPVVFGASETWYAYAVRPANWTLDKPNNWVLVRAPK